MDDPARGLVSDVVVAMKSLIAVLLLAAVSVSAQTIAISDRNVAVPAIAASRTSVLATWLSQEQLRAELIDFNGHLIAGPFALPSSSGAAIVSDGERFLVYWSDGTNVEGIFIRSDGSFDQPFTIVTGAASATAVFDGTRYLFFSSDGNTIQASPLTVQGIPERSFTIPVSNATVGGAASHDGVTALTWTQTAGHAWTASITFITRDEVAPPSLLATLEMTDGFGQTFLVAPAIAWNGSDWYAVWHAGRSGREDRYEGKVVSNSGTAVTVDDDYFTGKAYRPHVLAIGSQFLVTWTRDNPVSDSYVGCYVSGTGEPGPRISLSYQAQQIEDGATVALPDGTLVSFVAPAFSDAFIRFGRVARRRASR